MKRFIAATGFLALAVAPSLAADQPKIFAEGQKYVTDVKACSAAEGETDDALQLTAKGLFGYEFGCSFVQIHPIRFEDSDDIYQYLAIAACGDDSGVSRGDNIVISDNGDGSLRVTSQNEYVVQLVLERNGESTGANWIVEREFTRCPTN